MLSPPHSALCTAYCSRSRRCFRQAGEGPRCLEVQKKTSSCALPPCYLRVVQAKMGKLRAALALALAFGLVAPANSIEIEVSK